MANKFDLSIWHRIRYAKELRRLSKMPRPPEFVFAGESSLGKGLLAVTNGVLLFISGKEPLYVVPIRNIIKISAFYNFGRYQVVVHTRSESLAFHCKRGVEFVRILRGSV